MTINISPNKPYSGTFFTYSDSLDFSDADALPVVRIYRNNTDSGVTAGVADIGSGVYMFSGAAPNWSMLDDVYFELSVTIGGVIYTENISAEWSVFTAGAGYKDCGSGGQYVPVEGEFTGYISTYNSEGKFVDADNVPIISVYRNSSLSGESVAITSLGSGEYSYKFTSPASWVSGDVVVFVISVTMGGNVFVSSDSIVVRSIVVDDSIMPVYQWGFDGDLNRRIGTSFDLTEGGVFAGRDLHDDVFNPRHTMEYLSQSDFRMLDDWYRVNRANKIQVDWMGKPENRMSGYIKNYNYKLVQGGRYNATLEYLLEE